MHAYQIHRAQTAHVVTLMAANVQDLISSSVCNVGILKSVEIVSISCYMYMGQHMRYICARPPLNSHADVNHFSAHH